MLFLSFVCIFFFMENILLKLFKEVCNPNHLLYQLLPPFNQCKIDLRSKRVFLVQKLNTDRVRNESYLYYIRTWLEQISRLTLQTTHIWCLSGLWQKCKCPHTMHGPDVNSSINEIEK